MSEKDRRGIHVVDHDEPTTQDVQPEAELGTRKTSHVLAQRNYTNPSGR